MTRAAAALVIVLSCSGCALPKSSVPAEAIANDRRSEITLAQKPGGAPAAGSGLHPGKLLLVGVGILCAALVVLLIVEGTGY